MSATRRLKVTEIYFESQSRENPKESKKFINSPLFLIEARQSIPSLDSPFCSHLCQDSIFGGV